MLWLYAGIDVTYEAYTTLLRRRRERNIILCAAYLADSKIAGFKLHDGYIGIPRRKKGTTEFCDLDRMANLLMYM